MARGRGPAGILLAGGRFRSVLLVAALVAGCDSFGGQPVPPDAERIRMVNATTTPVMVTVNRAWIGTYPSWSSRDDLAVFGNGGPPWRVQFQTPGGQVLGNLTIDPSSGSQVSGFTYEGPCGAFGASWGMPQPDLPSIEVAPPPVDSRCR